MTTRSKVTDKGQQTLRAECYFLRRVDGRDTFWLILCSIQKSYFDVAIYATYTTIQLFFVFFFIYLFFFTNYVLSEIVPILYLDSGINSPGKERVRVKTCINTMAEVVETA